MAERLGYGGGYYDDYEDEEDQQYQESQVDDIPWYRLADPDYVPEEEELPEGRLEDFQEQAERVEHQLDAAAQLDAEAQFGWRSKARRRRKGSFVPPDIRTYRWPTFVRVEDLRNQDGS